MNLHFFNWSVFPALCNSQEDFAYMIDELLRRPAEYDVEISECNFQFLPGLDHFHGTLEFARCVTKSKLHTYKAIEITMGRECYLIFVCITTLDLMISAISV